MAEARQHIDYPYPDFRSNSGKGFYIVCNDKMILENVNTLLRGRGFLGMTDMEGRIHYLVDARKNVYSAVHRIVKEVDDESAAPVITNAMVLLGIEALFSRYSVDCRLTGGRILRSMLLRCARSPEYLSGVSNHLYPLVGKEFSLTSAQVERNVRYAIRKSGLPSAYSQNVAALKFLHENIFSWIIHKEKEGDRMKEEGEDIRKL